MPSAVDICNTALAYLGNSATVSSIDPSEGSAEADHCARFFPMALNELMEMHSWGFITRRIALAAVTNPTTSWTYAYALPSDAVNILAVLAPDAPDDYSLSLPMPYTYRDAQSSLAAVGYTPQPFVVSSDSGGKPILLTNQASAVLRYTVSAPDPSRLSPLASEALARLLAAKLAGPILKGDQGRAESQNQLKMFMGAFSMAVESDANQRQLAVRHSPVWMSSR